MYNLFLQTSFSVYVFLNNLYSPFVIQNCLSKRPNSRFLFHLHKRKLYFELTALTKTKQSKIGNSQLENREPLQFVEP